jgi:predicted CXXCH cytochrome family protein
MTKAEVPADFYTSFSEKKYALCWSCHSADMITADKTTSTTEFRNGDQNLHALHVKNVRKPMMCFACHDIHAATNPKLIEKWVEYRGVKLPIQFDKTAKGGSCTTACHGQKLYNRDKAVANAVGR